MKVTISSPGKFEPAYLAARYLESRGQLKRMITPVPYSRGARFGVSRERTTAITPIGAWNYGVQRWGPRAIQGISQLTVSTALDLAASRLLGDCDLVNGWSSTSLATIQEAHRRGVPAVLTVGSAHAVTQTELLTEEERLWGAGETLTHPRLVERMVAEYEEADGIIAPSRWVMESFLRRGVPASKLYRVPWGVIPIARPVDRSGRKGYARVLFVGGCSQRKGIPYLLHAFRQVEGRATLRLVGTPNPELLGRAGGLPTGSEAVGSMTTAGLAAEYDAADIFVLPSVEDGSALATILAMAAGLPVIVSDQAGADLVRDGENGFVVPARDITTLADRIDQLVADPELRARMGAAAALSAVTRTWEAYGEELHRTVYARSQMRGVAGAPEGQGADHMLAQRSRPAPQTRAPSRRQWVEELRTLAPKLAGTLGTSGASALLGILSGTLAARVLGPSNRGELAQLLLWPQLVVTVGNLGIDVAAVYLSGDEKRCRDVPATLLTMVLGQSLVLVPVYLILVPLVFRGSGVMPDAFWLTPLIPLYLVGSVSIDCLAGRLRFGAFNVVRIALPIAYCGGIAGLAIAGSLSPLTGAVAYLAAHGCADLLALVFVWRGAGLGRFDGALARSAAHFGLRAHFGRLSAQGLGVNLAIISLMLSSRDLGLYSAATAFLAAPTLVAWSIGLVVFPHVSATHHAGERPNLQAVFALHAAVVVVLAASLFVFAHPIVTLLFGPSYTAAAPALRLLAVASVAISIRSFPIEVLRGIGRPGLTSIAEAANWLLFLVAIPAGATVGGLLGTAAAVGVASYASLAVLVVLMWRSGVFESAIVPELNVAEVAA